MKTTTLLLLPLLFCSPAIAEEAQTATPTCIELPEQQEEKSKDEPVTVKIEVVAVPVPAQPIRCELIEGPIPMPVHKCKRVMPQLSSDPLLEGIPVHELRRMNETSA